MKSSMLLFIFLILGLMVEADAMVSTGSSVLQTTSSPFVGRRLTANRGLVRDPELESRRYRSVRPRLEESTAHVPHPRTKPRFKLATFNIISGRNERLVSAIRAMKQLNVDIALLTEAKLTNEAYTRRTDGYNVKATKALYPHVGGVALCWRESTLYQVEGVSVHGPNVISFELVTGSRRSLVIGAYIPPSDVTGTTCDFVLAAHLRRPRLPVILLGDLNVDLNQLPVGDERAAGIAATVALLGVKDLSKEFRSCRCNQYDYT